MLVSMLTAGVVAVPLAELAAPARPDIMVAQPTQMPAAGIQRIVHSALYDKEVVNEPISKVGKKFTHRQQTNANGLARRLSS